MLSFRWLPVILYVDYFHAGLWEFPLKLVDTDASRSQCKQRIEELLEGALGQALAAEHVVERRVLGEITHIFTHIRLTMRVEHIKIKVRLAPMPITGCALYRIICSCTEFISRWTFTFLL